MTSTPAANEIDQWLNLHEQVGTRPAETNVIKRVLDMVFRSETAWPVIAEEKGGLKEALFPYTLIVGLVPMVIGSVLASTVWGVFMSVMTGGVQPLSLPSRLFSTIVVFAYGLVGTLVTAKIMEVMAPYFGSRKSWVLSTRLLVYGFTPTCLAETVSWIPVLGQLVGLAAFIWSVILLMRGYRILLKEKPAAAQPSKTTKAEAQSRDVHELAGVGE